MLYHGKMECIQIIPFLLLIYKTVRFHRLYQNGL